MNDWINIEEKENYEYFRKIEKILDSQNPEELRKIFQENITLKEINLLLKKLKEIKNIDFINNDYCNYVDIEELFKKLQIIAQNSYLKK